MFLFRELYARGASRDDSLGRAVADITGVPYCFIPLGKTPLREIYACGGGLLAPSMNAPHLLFLHHNHTFYRMFIHYKCYYRVVKNTQNHWCTNRHRSTKTVPTVYQQCTNRQKPSKTIKRQSKQQK